MSNITASLVADDQDDNDFTYAGPAGYDPSEPSDTAIPHAAESASDIDKAERPTRRRKSKHAMAPEEHPEKWDDTPIFNQDLPPLQGNVQWFVRTSIRGQPDYQNVRKALRAGWRPRRKETVPEGFFPDTMRLTGGDLDFGDVVCNGDRILMERPKRLDDREKAMIAQENRNMNSLVFDSLSGKSEGQRGLVVGAQGQFAGKTFKAGDVDQFQFD